MEERNEKKEKITGDDIEKVTLEPITKAKSKEDKELQEWEVESRGGEFGAGDAFYYVLAQVYSLRLKRFQHGQDCFLYN